MIQITSEGIVLEDLGSRNGTFVNGTRVTKCRIKQGDKITVGSTEIRAGSMESGKSNDLLLGSTLGGFELQEILGRGSFGTVYRAMQLALQRPVAIKVLDDRFTKDPEKIKNFLLEARRAGSLNHPNVVQVHDVRQIHSTYMLVMELMTGGSAADLLRTNGPFQSDALYAVMVDMGRALSYAESQRLVHRDVKPDNILLSGDGIYKLADLGIAEPIRDDGQAHQVKTFGSAYYIAPEQARGGAIDGRADIYALGASIWHLATGKPVFEGTSRQIIYSHINEPPPDLSLLAENLDPAFVDVIYSMLAKDPTKRPTTGNEIADKVLAIVEGRNKPPVRTSRRATRLVGSAGSGRRRLKRIPRRR
jgi:serine/threonine protein kinase